MLTKTARHTFSLMLICLFTLVSGNAANAHEHRQRASFSFPVINISEDPRELSSITVKLNDHDVSMFARRHDDYVQLNLPTPLKDGEHRIVVLAHYKNGEIMPLLQKRFVLNAQQPGLRKATANSKQSDFFLDESNSEAPTNSIEFSAADRPAIISEKSGAADFEHMLPLLKVDSTDKDLKVENNRFIRAGDQIVEQQSLLFANYQRKGLTAGISGTGRQYQAQFFAFDENLTTGPKQRTLTPLNKEQSVGALASYSPLKDTDLITISTTYLRGEKIETGTNFHNLYHEQTLYGGDNWNVSMDSRLLNKALSVKSEYAWSEFVNKQTASEERYKKSSAWRTSAEWNNPSNGKRGLFKEWKVGAEIQEIGPEFWSLGNLNLANDIYTEKVYFAGTHNGFNLSAELIKEQNNIESRSKLPNQETDYFNINWYFTPSSLDLQNPLWTIFGQPSINGYAHFSERNQTDEDSLEAAYKTERQIDQYHISANFQNTNWNWSFQHSQTLMDDQSKILADSSAVFNGPLSDSRSYLTGLSLGLNPIDSVYLNFLIQLNSQKEKQSGNQFSNLNFGLESRFQLMPEKWSLNLNYTIHENENRFETDLRSNSYYRDQSINILTELKMLKPKSVSPGMNLFFSGSYMHQEETRSNERDEHYKLLVGCSLYWDKKG